jgi:geranylgeranyl reductase family protein
MNSTATTCQIAIVGAGPAGSTAAYLLASQGMEVILVDRQHFPRPKLCAGLLTWKTMQLLKSIYGLAEEDLMARGIVLHRTWHYRLCCGCRVIAEGCLDYPFHLVERSTYDHFWLQAAVDAGARAFTGQAVRRIEPVAGVVGLADGRQIKARVIIGADGVWSKVRRSIDDHPARRRRWLTQTAMAIETFQPSNAQQAAQQFATLHFGLIPWGYAWSFPKGDHRVFGIAGLHHKNDRPLMEGFQNFMTSLGQSAQPPAVRHSHPLPWGSYLDRPGRGRVLLVGDACGLADPLLGEGIYYAHRSAQIAAQSILACTPGFRDLDRHYRARLKTGILRELRWIKLYRTLLFAGGRRRRYRGLKFVFRIMPKRLEAAIQGQRSFARLLWPARR